MIERTTPKGNRMNTSDPEQVIQASAQIGPDTRLQAEVPIPLVPAREVPVDRRRPFPYLGAISCMFLGALGSFALIRTEYWEGVQGPSYSPGQTGMCPGIGNFRDFGELRICLLGGDALWKKEFADVAEGRRIQRAVRLTSAAFCAVLGFYLGFLLGRWGQRREEAQWRRALMTERLLS
jgi:hypothetical protein